jgi:hypothetical protein
MQDSIQLLKEAGRISTCEPKPVTRKIFRHTVFGKPAYFDGKQILRARGQRKRAKGVSIVTILAERTITKKYLKKIKVPFKIDDYSCVQVGEIVD